MRLRSLLASAALAATMGIGSIAMMAGPASAATVTNNPECWSQQCNQPPKCNDIKGGSQFGRDNCGICHEVTTPQEPNLTYVTNTTGETVTVTLGGNYYWVQTKNPSHFYGPWTKTVVLAPWESISVAWYKHTGDHWWTWTGQERCIPQPRPCVTDGWNQWQNSGGTWSDSRCTRPEPHPVNCVTTTGGRDQQDTILADSSRPQCDPCNEGVLSITRDIQQPGNCLPCFPVITHITPPPCSTQKGHDGNGKDPGSWGLRGITA